MNPKVDFYFSKATRWQHEIKQLRRIVLDGSAPIKGLTEELKWGVPCYTFPNPASKKRSNIVLIHVFKEYCAALFFKGALLNDAHGLLIQQTENVQVARQARFTSVKQVLDNEAILKAYLYEAIEVETAGLTPVLKQTADYETPEEFQKKLSDDPKLKEAFERLTPGRQRAYKLFFSAPKQSKTREARIEKSVPQILIGKGLND